MPLPPALTPEQRQAALDKAAAARRERAELKEKLKMGSVNLRELLNLADAHEVVAKMKVLAVLESLPGVGKVKARRTMEEIGISETRRVRGLGRTGPTGRCPRRGGSRVCVARQPGPRSVRAAPLPHVLRHRSGRPLGLRPGARLYVQVSAGDRGVDRGGTDQVSWPAGSPPDEVVARAWPQDATTP